MKKFIFLFLPVVCLYMQSAYGLPKYGDAVIKRGSLTVVRQGQSTVYNSGDQAIEIQQKDVLRAGRSSQIVLSTVEETSVRMGSNAVFQVKSWQQRQKTGLLRMLYGKMLFKTKKLRGRNRFRLKTATAIMGVKGTEGNTEVGSTGNTVLVCNTGVCTMQGNSGDEVDVPKNRASMSTGGKTSNTFEAEVETETEKGDANESGSANVKLEQNAVDAGVVDQGDLDKSKDSQADMGEQFASADGQAQADVDDDATETDIDWVVTVKDIIDATKDKATEQSTFKTGKINVDFEK